MRITKQMRTETAHRLVDYDGRCAHLHGHSYLWEVTAYAAELTPNGMVADFKFLKQAMMNVLDPLDHALVLSPGDPLWRVCDPVPLHTVLRATNGVHPRLFQWHDNPTAESFAKWALDAIERELQLMLRNDDQENALDVAIISVKVWETATSFAEVRRYE